MRVPLRAGGDVWLSYIKRRRRILEGILGEDAKLSCLVGQPADLIAQIIHRFYHLGPPLRFQSDTAALKGGACVWTPPHLRIASPVSAFGFTVRHFRAF